MSERKYLPTLAELVDRLSISQLKEVFITEHKEEYAQEIKDILHDIQLILEEGKEPINAETIRAIVVLSQMNLHIWHNESNYRKGIRLFGCRIQRLGNKLELTDTQKYQLDFVKSNDFVYHFPYIIAELDRLHSESKIDILEYKKRLKKWMYDNVKTPSVLSLGCEIIIKDFFVKISQEILEKFPKECYISAGTSDFNEYFIDPLIQLWMWKGCGHVIMYEDDLFNKNHFSDINKDLKGILTINRETFIRDYLDKNITSFDGFYNYAQKTKNYLSWQTHSKISRRSFVNFIVESDCYDLTVPNSNNNGNHFTEKTFLPILEESIIIVLGGYGYVESLKKMGIKTWNEEFGFIDNIDFKKRVDSYVKCIEYFNKLSYNDVVGLYERDKHYVLQNKKILESVIYS